MVPHTWIKEILKIFGMADNLVELITTSMKDWRTKLYASGKFLGSVSINRGIFQGDSFSHLLFVLALIPLSMALGETGIGYDLEKEGPKINHLLYMDDLKLYAKNEDQIDALVQTVHICSADISMEFDVSKCDNDNEAWAAG